MTSPSVSGDLYHRDDRLIAQFRFDQGACFFRVQNISPGTIDLLLNKATISIDNDVHAVRTYESYYAAEPIVRAVSLPPLGHLTDLVLPADHVIYSEGAWQELPLIPATDVDEGQSLGIGGSATEHRISLTLPLVEKGEEIAYRFEFVNEGYERSYDGEVMGRPPVPAARKANMYDQLLMAGAVAGFGILLVIIFQSDRSSPIPE